MSLDSKAKHARDTIGPNTPKSDWRIDPSSHANVYSAAAPSLTRVLEESRVTGVAKIFESLDAEAVKAQKRFKRNVQRANGAVLATAVFGALLLIVGSAGSILGDAAERVVLVIGCLGVITSGLATMWLTLVQSGHLAARWSKSRAEAEAKRLQYFKSIIEEANQTVEDQLLVFEYTRRYLLDNQLDYFRERGMEHEDGADRALVHSTAAVFISSTITAIAGFAAAALGAEWAAIAGLAVISTAYAAYATSQSAVNLDRRNADRYRTALSLLRDHNLTQDAYIERIVAGDFEALREFYNPVFEILVNDHKDFIDSEAQRDAAIMGIEERLEVAKRSLGRGNDGAAGGAGTSGQDGGGDSEE